MRDQLLGAGLLVGMAITGSALAAGDVPGDPTTRATLKLGLEYRTGIIEGAHDADWYRVKLVRGKHYAFQILVAPPTSDTCESFFLFEMTDAAGRVLHGGGADECESDAGFELTAPRTGVYFVRLSGPERVGYALRVARDVVDDQSTKAKLHVNKPLNGTLLFGNDVDYFRIRLSAGKSYNLEVVDRGSCSLLAASVQDKSGNSLADVYRDSREQFSPPITGEYFVVVLDLDEGSCPYTVSVTKGTAS